MAFILDFFVSIYELCSKRRHGLNIDGTEAPLKKICYDCGYESEIDTDGYSSDKSVDSAEYTKSEITFVI